APFMHIDPSYSGGEIENTIQSECYTINIHKKVFPALIGEGSEGFRQITIINNDSTINNYNIPTFAADSETMVEVKDNVPIVTKKGLADTIIQKGLSDKKLIFRINEKK
ncbi:MAG: hypothetical protein II165_04350, partial [Bacteroidales bacterium]|nr:hypothetical protein [Bacteroidales bacterium]